MVELLLDTITVPAFQQQEAWIWIPILIAVAALGGALIAAFSEETETTKLIGKSIGVLGMIGSGKTQFLKNLQGEGEKYQREGYQGTNKAEYQKFTFKIGDKQYEIKDGIDIGGETYNIKPYYEKFLENKDICIFLFDVQKYKDNSEYRKDTNVRLDFINNHVKDASKCAIIGSHVDKAKIEEGQSIITIVQKLVEGKEYARLLNTNFFAYNLTCKEDMNKLLNKLFL